MDKKTRDIRNVAFIGHGDAGKTTLARALLTRGGVSEKKGESLFDCEADEHERGYSIDATSGHLVWKDHEINVIDAPGGSDFVGDVISALNGADMGFVCVNAHSGIMVNTRRSWEAAKSARRPVGFIITKTDTESPERVKAVFASIREAFGRRVVPINGPADLGDFSAAWKEGCVEVDDELMLRYLEGETIDEETLEKAGRIAVAKRSLFPVLFVSGVSGDGVTELLDFIAVDVPGPNRASRHVVDDNGEKGEAVDIEDDGPFLGVVWKIQMDKHVGKIAHVRCVSGSLHPGDVLHNLRADHKEKIHQILQAQGKEMTPIKSAIAGDLIVLTKLESLHIGDTLSQIDGHASLWSPPYPEPMYFLAATPKTRGDEAKVSEALAKVTTECPTFKARREPATGELVLSGMSQLHLDIWLRRIKDRFGLELETTTPKVPYRESIQGAGEARYRHKKQSGGRGQFAEVALKVSAAEEGAGLVYSWDIFGGSIPVNFKEAIHKGIAERMSAGCIAGFPMEDVMVSIVDGKHHPVDSSDQAFKIAGGRAFLEAARMAKPVILEPLVALEIHIPGDCMGDVTADLNGRRGRIHGMEQDGEFQVLKAEMPLSEAMDYSRALTSITSGEGAFTMSRSHYEHVPGQVQASLVEHYKPHGDDD